ncbi:MAG: transglutaminase-like domain-containing protein [Peptococcaceae bacterium]|jgi:hypothetical protein|nr:transglutaminase-like domain-containing protein [Peptococcaceae bacterium]
MAGKFFSGSMIILLVTALALVSLGACAAPAATAQTAPGGEGAAEAGGSGPGGAGSEPAADAGLPLEGDDGLPAEGEIIDIQLLIGDDFDIVALADTPPTATTLMPVASGKTVFSNDATTIDASNTADGYVMIKFNKPETAKLKVIVECPSKVNYTYNLSGGGNYEVFPLSDGSGAYKISVYKNVSGTKYSTVYSASASVALKNEFAPFLLPNQYVNYNASSKAVALAKELVKDTKDELEAVAAVYDYVVKNITYYKERAANVQSGYLPNIDTVLAEKKGICFDYAALMTAMLRSQGIPCKLVIGYAGTVYHAWINVYTKEEGWVDSVIYFDGVEWKRMDPTFASSGGSSESAMQYIGDGKNYSAKYLY